MQPGRSRGPAVRSKPLQRFHAIFGGDATEKAKVFDYGKDAGCDKPAQHIITTASVWRKRKMMDLTPWGSCSIGNQVLECCRERTK